MTTPCAGTPPKRNRYFDGRFLTARDLTDEQEYHRKKLWLHNRCLHGYGVACGLQVTCAGADLQVSPGVAIDGHGREIVVPLDTIFTIPLDGKVAYLAIRYTERETDPVPIEDADGTRSEYSRIEEGYELGCEPADPRRGFDGPSLAVPLARLVRGRGRWRIDRRFRRPRTR